ncbi:hypothetical protein V6N13_084073 [Hibiscus sabdariffa]
MSLASNPAGLSIQKLQNLLNDVDRSVKNTFTLEAPCKFVRCRGNFSINKLQNEPELKPFTQIAILRIHHQSLIVNPVSLFEPK